MEREVPEGKSKIETANQWLQSYKGVVDLTTMATAAVAVVISVVAGNCSDTRAIQAIQEAARANRISNDMFEKSMRDTAESQALTRRQRSADTYLTMRSHYMEMISKLHEIELQLERDPANADPRCTVGVRMHGTAHGRALKAYWEQVFDEWYVTTKLDQEELGQLWHGFGCGSFRATPGHAQFTVFRLVPCARVGLG
jgi:hypothetical protein